MNQPVKARGDTFRLGVVGDLHSHWDEVDLAQISGLDYDLLFFTGDLGGGTAESSLRAARAMAALEQPTLVMPGNNDTHDIDALAAELAHQSGLSQLLSIARNDARLANPVTLCGYSHDRIRVGGREIALLAGRPHSMGGPDLSFPDYMLETYGVTSLEDSSRRLMALVDAVEPAELIFLSHNGPHGLGGEANDIWGCDFKTGGGDWGDPDLAVAIDHARSRGKRVLAVIAGHMHLRTRQGEERPWKVETAGTVYINAARVPRIFSDRDDIFRHHVSVTIDEESLQVEEILTPQYG